MKYGETTQYDVLRVDHKGRGCGQVKGRTASGYFCFPGEEIIGKCVGRQRGVFKMEVEELIKPSPHRIEPKCPQAGSCGGCKWQMIDYEYQLELKKGLVERSLGPVGLGDMVKEVIPAKKQYHFRNRMDYCVGWEGTVGLKQPGRWNGYLDLETCLLLSPEAPEVIARFRNWMQQNEIEPYDGKRNTGFLRYLVIREGKNTGKRMVTVVTGAAEELPAKDRLMEALDPLATTLYWGINPTLTDLSLAEDLRLLKGGPNLEEEVNGKRFLIPPNSFFQTNTAMAGELLTTVGDMLAAGGRRVKKLLDLYCGVGFFGIGLANRVDEVVGVEIDEQAIAIASRNAELNGLKNARFAADKAESLTWEGEKPDVAIIDPPRAGLHPKVIKTLLAERPERLVYVSCNFVSLARDWNLLQEGYRCLDLKCLDLFPHGPHVETVLLLERK